MCLSAESFIFQGPGVTPSTWPGFEFLIGQCSATPACNWESTHRARMRCRCLQHWVQNAELVCVCVCVCVFTIVKCVCAHCVNMKQKVQESWGANGMKWVETFFPACESTAWLVGLWHTGTGAWCINVYAVLYVISPCRTAVHSEVSAIYMLSLVHVKDRVKCVDASGQATKC